MKSRAKQKHNRVSEEDIIEGHIRLLEALIFNAFEQIHVAKDWGKKRKLTNRTIERKIVEIEQVSQWLKSPASDFWFGIYESCIVIDKGRTRKSFISQLRKSKNRIKKLSNSQMMAVPKK